MKKLLPVTLVVLLLATACFIPVSADVETEPYFFIDFNDCTLGDVAAGTLLSPVFRVDDTGSTIVAREGDDKALRFDDKKDAPNKMNNGFLPFTNKINGASNFSQLPNDVILSYDFFISEGNGEVISLFNGRSPVKKWGKALELKPDEATGLGKISGTLISGGSVASEPCVPYGQWVTIQMLIKQNPANTAVAKIDIYINDALVLEGFEAHGDFSNITVVKFAQDAVSPTDCYILTDNILLAPVKQAETDAPSDEVTETPTAEVTAAPTAEATKTPTAEATKTPTAEVTKTPTAEATKAPTAEVTVPNAPETNAPTNESEKTGCGASVGAIGLIALISTVSCGALALKKKYD